MIASPSSAVKATRYSTTGRPRIPDVVVYVAAHRSSWGSGAVLPEEGVLPSQVVSGVLKKLDALRAIFRSVAALTPVASGSSLNCVLLR